MSKAWFRHGLGWAALLAVVLALTASGAHARPRPGKRRALNLFAGVLGRENVNRFDCGVNAFGEVCVDPNGSTTVGGGFWPKGTPDQYVFNSGLQLAGIVDPAVSGFAWASDTVGAFFFDPKGTTVHGDKLSLVWNSLNTTDEANWPRDAFVPNDPALYNSILIGRLAASQQDTWMQYWDGNPAFNAGRKHPLGVLVTQRGLAWNFPTGNEDIIYFLYTFTNITAKDPAKYAGLPNADSLTSLGGRFQALNEAAFGVAIPDTGYTITQLYAAFAMDADVSDAARENYSTAFLPFAMGTAFKGNWFAPAFLFPPTIFGAPFASAPGFVGVKYLKSPLVNPSDPSQGEVGLTLFSNTINGGQFDDAQNTTQLWRYLSGKLDPSAGDAPCVANPVTEHVCFITQSTDDIRFFQSSGPLTLKPGESQTIVVAYIGAAPVNRPEIAGRGQNFDLPPTYPAQPAALAAGTDTFRTVDRIMGALSIVGDTGGAPGGGSNGKIDQNEIRVVPRSLLGKGLVAQAVFDSKFLLPFPPTPPEFFLVPGENQVTVVWRDSRTETDGDPYFAVASDPTSALYDANYREFDVEGYRVYRGRTTGDLQLIAQFDKAGTQTRDFTFAFNYGNCAPELGVTTDCPAAGEPHDLVGNVIQIPPGGRQLVADAAVNPTLAVQVTLADTALTGGASGFPPLEDTGIPFAFTDRGVRNSFRYFYAVTAFDVNSVRSVGVGATALESPRLPKAVTPRAASGQETAGVLRAIQMLGADGQVLNPSAPLPTLNPATGIFSGPMPPTNGSALGLAEFVPQVLGQDSSTLRLTIDSIVPGATLGNEAARPPQPATYYLTGQSGTAPPVSFTIPVLVDGFGDEASGFAYFPAKQTNGAQSSRFGGDATFALFAKTSIETPGGYRTASWGRADINSNPKNSAQAGPRWWGGTPNENTIAPNELQCTPAAGGCLQGDLTRNAGSLPGVQVLFHPQSYSTVPNVPQRRLEGIGATVARAGDFKVYWGTTPGAIDSVIDVTHRVPVPFSTKLRASWGILNDSSFAGVTASGTPDTSTAKLTWTDAYCVDPVPALIGQCTGTPTLAVFQDHARLSPVVATASTFAGSAALTAGAATGTGFIFYLNGHFFVMQMVALPAFPTVWNARFFSGSITGQAADGDYKFVPAIRPPAVPGLRLAVTFGGSAFDPTTTPAAALDRVHTVPDPYYVTNALEQSTNSKVLRFVNLPSQCIIRIYSLSGVLVNVLTLNDATGGGELTWNLRNRNNQFVASGVYFYHVETFDGKTRIGRFTVVNFAQ